ncbi:Peptidase B [bacterium HR40]|nr:Peptidase B [bacterium HR40]
MLPGFVPAGEAARPLRPVRAADLERVLAELGEPARRWREETGFVAKPGAVLVLPSPEGGIRSALFIVSEPPSLWDVAAAREGLRSGVFRIDDPEGLVDPAEAALGWALASYRFRRYRDAGNAGPTLAMAVPEAARIRAEAIFLARDLVNTPANDLGPEELGDAVRDVAARFGARFSCIAGETLLERDYPAIFAVGRASPRPPRLLDLVWGDEAAPRLTLVGKGVCFDTGGLDIKPASSMALMKKDMGGAALMLALAQAIMASGFAVRLRLLVPAVDNAIDGAAFRPGDVVRTRKGITVEIGNTDAEGRLILADALAEADGEKPDLLLDAATLTGAARVALGPDLPALFTPDEDLAAALLAQGRRLDEPLWRLPLHEPYRRYLESRIADLDNAGKKPFAGAITAALFLRSFVEGSRSWAHLDIFAWNDEHRPGRPVGGEASGFRPLFAHIEDWVRARGAKEA